MAWPQANEFQDAVLNPQLSFLDADLKEAEVVCAANGLPKPASGQFGIVYQMRSAKGRWAVKCFTGDIPGRHERYRKISAHLRNAGLPFTVGFDYLDQGIYLDGQWYPVLKMDWVEGQTLNQFIGEQIDKPVLKILAETWLKLAQHMRAADIVHADLQHGNVMLIPAKIEGRVSLKLVDYDGMYLPSLAGTRSGELGHPTYQHPQRLTTGYYGPEVDCFSHLVIYTALHTVLVRGRSLWETYNHGDNLLFNQADFKEPAKSKVLHELWQDGSDDIRLTGRLLLASAQTLVQVPTLDDVLEGTNVRPLTTAEVQTAERLLRPSNTSLAAGSIQQNPLKDVPSNNDNFANQDEVVRTVEPVEELAEDDRDEAEPTHKKKKRKRKKSQGLGILPLLSGFFQVLTSPQVVVDWRTFVVPVGILIAAVVPFLVMGLRPSKAPELQKNLPPRIVQPMDNGNQPVPVWKPKGGGGK